MGKRTIKTGCDVVLRPVFCVPREGALVRNAPRGEAKGRDKRFPVTRYAEKKRDRKDAVSRRLSKKYPFTKIDCKKGNLCSQFFEVWGVRRLPR